MSGDRAKPTGLVVPLGVSPSIEDSLVPHARGTPEVSTVVLQSTVSPPASDLVSRVTAVPERTSCHDAIGRKVIERIR